MKGMEEMTREEGKKIIGKIMEESKKYAPLTAYRVTYQDGSTSQTNMAAGVTLEDAKKYFIGKWFACGTYPGETMLEAVSVEEI